jgi:hypothetical protein
VGLDFNHPTKSLLQQEQELLDSGEIENEDDLTRLYPNIIGNGHPDGCLCFQCAPGEYEYNDIDETVPGNFDYGDDDDTLVIYFDTPFENFGYTDEQLDALAASERNFYRKGNASVDRINAKTIYSGTEPPDDDDFPILENVNTLTKRRKE